MKTSIATVSISGSLREKLPAIRDASFDGIEIFEADFIADPGSPREIGSMIRDHGLEITLFQPFRDFEGLTGEARQRAFDRADHKFDLMGELGCELMLVCSSLHPDARGGIDRMAEDFRVLGERAATRGLRVGYEALAWGRHVNDHRDAWEVVRRANHPNVGLILDSFHTLGRGLDPETIRNIPGDCIFFVQLADAPRIEMDLLYWSRHFRCMPGEGDLDVAAFMRAVGATGYEGPLSLEIFNDQFRAAHPGTIARDGYRSLVALMDDVRRLEPPSAIALPNIPARVPVEGVEFVEFATGPKEAPALEKRLAALGFAHVGDHVSKRVALWQQGGIRIVLNTEPEGFAHSSYVMHGTNVCDIGLRVASAADTVARANAMGAETHEQPVGPGELDIPAIQGMDMGGGVLHFIDESSGLDRVWDVEFRPSVRGADGDGGSNDAGVGLLRVDHLAHTTTYDEMLSWALFHTSIFDLRPKPMVDVIDPDGLVRSRAIEAPDRALRLTLNGTETHRTLAGHFLSDSGRSALQHIAFVTEDIVSTADALAARGFDALPMPENYYRDLAARFGLGNAELDRLRDANILYDRDDDGGVFHQLYGRPTPEGLFFEIVQRSGGYDGYGAANAPFRIAAQKRFLRAKGMPRR